MLYPSDSNECNLAKRHRKGDHLNHKDTGIGYD